MFCQFCGAEATQDLKYCKRCGGNLNLPATSTMGQDMTRQRVSPFTVAAVGLTTAALVIFGLLVVFGMIYNISDGPQGVRGDALIWLAGFGSLTVFGSVFLLMRLWTMLLGNQPQGQSSAFFQLRRPAAPQELGAPVINNTLPAASAPVSSVTEHTTRTFEPAYRERQQ